VTGSGIDTPRRSQQDYAIVSTLPLDTVDIAAPRPMISTAELSPTNVHNGVLDPVGNNNTASDPYVVELEHTRPAPVLSTVSSSPVNASRITFTVDFGEPVNADTFTASDV
jgi:hypothetical protein